MYAVAGGAETPVIGGILLRLGIGGLCGPAGGQISPRRAYSSRQQRHRRTSAEQIAPRPAPARAQRQEDIDALPAPSNKEIAKQDSAQIPAAASSRRAVS